MSIDDLLYNKKYPSSRKKHVGIEIECLLTNANSKKLDKLLIEKNLQWNVHVGTDGSVRDTHFAPTLRRVLQNWGGYTEEITNEKDRKIGKEIRILAEEKEAPEVINEVCELLKICQAEVNDTCGLHVHIDMRNREHDKVYNNFFRFQDLMYLMQPVKRSNNKFCKKLKRILKTKATERYYGINKQSYHDRRTFEIRLHEGTVDASDIKRWVYLLVKIANFDKVLERKVSNFNVLNLSDRMKEYVNSRIEKFTVRSGS